MVKTSSAKFIQTIFSMIFTKKMFSWVKCISLVEFFSSFKKKHSKRTENLQGKGINNISCRSCHLKVGLQNVDGSWKCFMSTATEQCHSSIEQDGSNQRCVGNASQAFDATLKASYKKEKKKTTKLYPKSKNNVLLMRNTSVN